MEKEIHYCGICKKDTEQLVEWSTHERDSSSDYQRCLECGSYYLGLSGKWHEDDNWHPDQEI